MNRWGRGHVLAFCDRTTLAELLEHGDIRRYLTSSGALPRIATVGDGYPCVASDDDSRTISPATHLRGDGLAALIADPARASEEWDLIVICADSVPEPPVDEILPLLERFVRDDGGGLAVVADYLLYLGAERAERLSRLIEPAGFRFVSMALPDATFDLDLPCVPDL